MINEVKTIKNNDEHEHTDFQIEYLNKYESTLNERVKELEEQKEHLNKLETLMTSQVRNNEQ